MKEDLQSTKDNRDQPNAHKLLTVQMRQEFGQLREKMAAYEGCIEELCTQMALIKNAIAKAEQAADYLLDDDAMQAFEAIRRLQQAADLKACTEEDWETEEFEE